jgi:hypothetical protein
VSYQAIEPGTTERFFTAVKRVNGDPITTGMVDYYLKAKSGPNVGKWWRDSDQTWQATETANEMTHEADGHWEIDLSESPFDLGIRYLEYVKEATNLHIPDARHVIASKDGQYQIAVTIQDSASDPVADALVTLLEAPSSVQTGRQGLSNVNGVARVNTTEGNWYLRITPPPGYVTPADILIAVTGDTVTTVTLDDVPAPASVAPGLCHLTGYIFLNGDPVPGAIVKAQLKDQNSSTSTVLLSLAKKESVADLNGYVSLYLVRGDQFASGTGVYQINAYDKGTLIWSIDTVIPNQSSGTIQALLD